MSDFVLFLSVIVLELSRKLVNNDQTSVLPTLAIVFIKRCGGRPSNFLARKELSKNFPVLLEGLLYVGGEVEVIL